MLPTDTVIGRFFYLRGAAVGPECLVLICLEPFSGVDAIDGKIVEHLVYKQTLFAVLRPPRAGLPSLQAVGGGTAGLVFWAWRCRWRLSRFPGLTRGLRRWRGGNFFNFDPALPTASVPT